MWSFVHNHRGAVTVFVTLILVPAVLISGTAVDVARIYAARGVLQNANQLTANSALANYDALLKDLYGLYAISQEDEALGEAINTYINTAVFGKDLSDAELGDLRLFGGSAAAVTEAKGVDGLSLANVDVLRRQIEEYAKFRAPVIIVQDIIGRIEQFSKLKNDSEAILEKLTIDDEFAEIVEAYKELYLRLRYNDYYLLTTHREEFEIRLYDFINEQLEIIHDSYEEMLSEADDYRIARDEFEYMDSNVPEGLTPEEQEDYLNEMIELEEAMEEARNSFDGRQSAVKAAALEIEDYISEVLSNSYPSDYYEYTTGYYLNSYQKNLTELTEICGELEEESTKLKEKIDNLRTKLEDCSDELSEGVGTSLDDYASLIEQVKANTVNGLLPNKDYLDALRAQLEDGIAYANLVNNTPDISTGRTIRSLASSGPQFSISVVCDDPPSPGAYGSEGRDYLENLADISNYQYKYFHDASLLKMKRFVDLGSTETDIYATLAMLYGTDGEDDGGDKKAIKNAINNICGNAKTALAGYLFDPRGADEIPDSVMAALDSVSETYANPLDNGDWNKAGENNKAAKNTLGEAASFFGKLGNAFGDAADKILLLCYDTEMFSNYATQFKDDAETMTGIPYSVKVNYMLDAEQEFLFHGSANAVENLLAVSGLLLLTRFVFNYISTFIIPSVKATLLTVQATFAWTGPFSIVIRELARVGLALAESALDVASLRSGNQIPLLKTQTPQWQFGLGALVSLAENVAQGMINAAVAEMKSAILSALTEAENMWKDAAGNISETLNRAESIDKTIESITGESAGISELKSGFEQINNGVSDAFDLAKTEAGNIEAPTVDLGAGEPGETEPNLEDVKNGNVKLKPTVTFGYTDYLRLFFLFVDGDVMADRTAQLIALNLTNYTHNIGDKPEDERVSEMENATPYDMSKAYTAVSVQTTVDLRFIFLSMALFQNHGDGNSWPPKYFPVSQTDYRGY